MQPQPRILRSTAYRNGPLYDYWGSNTLQLNLRPFWQLPLLPKGP